MGLVCSGGLLLLDTLDLSSKLCSLIAVVCLVPLGVLVYFLVLRRLRAEVLIELRQDLGNESN